MENERKHLIEFAEDANIHVAENQTLLSASIEAGIPIFHICGGKAKCSTCRVLVIEGLDALTPPNDREKKLRHQMHFPPNVRLACQTYARGGPIRLSRILKDETDIGLYVGSLAGEATQQIGEEQELALFFLDIRNFTPFIEKHLAFDVVHIVRKLFIICQTIIEDNHGQVIEIAGDNLYAGFGFRESKVQAVKAAVHASLTILEDIEMLNQTYFLPYFHYSIEVGIGLHFGKVITGNIRLGAKNNFVVMGYAVNIAARLQAMTRRLNNNFIVSDEVISALQNPPPNYRSVSADLKGMTGLCQVHLLGKPYVHDIENQN